MGTNFERFLFILSKWPSDLIKIQQHDYGHHLRQLVKNKDMNGNVFPGGSVENSKIMDSLLRLLNNIYTEKYPCSTKGASGLDMQVIEEILKNNLSKTIVQLLATLTQHVLQVRRYYYVPINVLQWTGAK